MRNIIKQRVMRSGTRMYCWAAPLLMLLPVLDFSFGQIPFYLKGTEFRTIISTFLTQIFAAVSDTFILAFVDSIFGSNLGG